MTERPDGAPGVPDVPALLVGPGPAPSDPDVAAARAVVAWDADIVVARARADAVLARHPAPGAVRVALLAGDGTEGEAAARELASELFREAAP